MLVDMGNKQNKELGFDAKFRIKVGGIDNIPFKDEYFDFVFCSDVLGLVKDLDSAISECARVLKPGGKALFYATSFKTNKMSEDEADFLGSTLGGDRGKLLTTVEVEEALDRCFKVRHKKIVGSQFSQSSVEHQGDKSEAAQNLLKIARLQTWPDRYIKEYGHKTYRIVLAEVMWSPFILLGKLQPTIYIVQKA